MTTDHTEPVPGEESPVPDHESGPEEMGEATTLSNEIKNIAAELNPENLEVEKLRVLTSAVGRLIEIAEMRETSRQDILRLRSEIEDWENSRSEKFKYLEAKEPLRKVLETLKESAIEIGREEVEAVLQKCDEVLATEDRFRKKRGKYFQAIEENDYGLVASVAPEMASLEDRREAAYDKIREILSELLPPGGEKVAPRHETKSEEIFPDDNPDEPPLGPKGKALPTEEGLTENKKDSTESQVSVDSGVGEEGLGKEEFGEKKGEVGKSSPEKPRKPDKSVEGIEALIATEIKRGRLGLAYHLAKAMPDALPGPSGVALVASNYVTDESAPVVDDLHVHAAELLDKFGDTLDKKPNNVKISYASLIASAAISHAMVVPYGLVSQLLKSLEPRLEPLPSLQALVQSVIDASNEGAYLPIELLREESSLDDWKEKVEALQKEGKTWIEAERKSKIKFRRATKVWYWILEDWKETRCFSIGQVFKLLEEPIDSVDASEIKKLTDYWRQHWEREVDRIDRSIRPAVSTDDITAGARRSLQKKIQEAIAFLDRWCRLLEVRPVQKEPFHKEWKIKLGETSQNFGEDALIEIRDLHTPVSYQTFELLQRYIAIFEDEDTKFPTTNLRLHDLLNGDLFADPYIKFNDSGIPLGSPLKLDRFENLINQEKSNFPEAIVERAKKGDFAGVEMALDFVERAGVSEEETIDRVRNQVEIEREQVEKDLEGRIRDIKDRLDAAYARGILTMEEVEKYRPEIPSNDLGSIDDFEPHFEECEIINHEIEESQERRRAEATDRLERLKKDKSVKPADIERIEQAIEVSSYQVAEDYIERVGGGDPLPKHELKLDRPFDGFFPTFVQEYVAFAEDPNSSEFPLERIRKGLECNQQVGPVDGTALSAEGAGEGAKFIEAWLKLHSGNPKRNLLKVFLSTLGFTSVEVSGGSPTSTKENEFGFRTTPIVNRWIAQLPDFGSRANGSYRALLFPREKKTSEAIIQSVKRFENPTIVLFGNVLDIHERRELSRNLNYGTYPPTLVLDEGLIAFLSGQSGDRLGAFFDCASAFSFSQPFDPEALEVPPEMFFGRESEREAILSMSGGVTHLVYGGRRLGKTVLFRNIEREFMGSENELVIFLSLRGSEIGQNLQNEELWSLFARELAVHNIVHPRTHRAISVRESVTNWLKENSRRRILFLVDEADDFLVEEQDSKYTVLEQLKKLMDDTEKRFKVVFAGLHNVQRSANDSNNPFTHRMGNPVRIGPMLPDTDPTLIENLIRAPFETLGYRFDSNDSVIRIAAETNYYPALAQLFCRDLLDNLRQNQVEGPPFSIRREDIDRVFDSRETRDRIRNLFSWTIQLDPRYEFLTYLIAKESFESGNVESTGVSIADIRKTSLNDWSQGFDSGQSNAIFQLLLEEMVDLGILREVGDKRFSIRTRNLRMLLGNDEEIDRRYEDATKREPLERPHPSMFRRTIDKRPAPLTAGNENQILSTEPSVGLIFGSHLGGLDQVHQSLKDLCETLNQNAGIDRNAIDLHHALDQKSLLFKLEKVSKRRRGFYIILVDPGAWDRDLISQVLDFVSGHRARARTIRPIFLGGLAEAWRWVKESPIGARDNASLWDIWLGPCDKNFSRKWLLEKEAQAYYDIGDRNRMIDLPWPAVLETVAFRVPIPQSIEEGIRFALEEQDLVSDILDVPEVENALRVLAQMFPEKMTPDDLSDLLEDKISPQEALRIFDWANRLGIVQDREGYRLDFAYAKGLEEIFKV